jgi:hypothetical protein
MGRALCVIPNRKSAGRPATPATPARDVELAARFGHFSPSCRRRRSARGRPSRDTPTRGTSSARADAGSVSYVSGMAFTCVSEGTEAPEFARGRFGFHTPAVGRLRRGRRAARVPRERYQGRRPAVPQELRERLDREIVADMRVPLAKVRSGLAALSAGGAVVMFRSRATKAGRPWRRGSAPGTRRSGGREANVNVVGEYRDVAGAVSIKRERTRATAGATPHVEDRILTWVIPLLLPGRIIDALFGLEVDEGAHIEAARQPVPARPTPPCHSTSRSSSASSGAIRATDYSSPRAPGGLSRPMWLSTHTKR